MATRARITLAGATATLQQDGKTLTVAVVSPAGAALQTGPAEPPPDNYNAKNPGVQLLSFTITAPPGGSLDLEVVLTPANSQP
jgi:hypothetical protein